MEALGAGGVVTAVGSLLFPLPVSVLTGLGSWVVVKIRHKRICAQIDKDRNIEKCMSERHCEYVYDFGCIYVENKRRKRYNHFKLKLWNNTHSLMDF